MSFAKKIQKIRQISQMTQESFAEKLGVSRQSIAKWETGQFYPEIENLIQISNILSVSLENVPIWSMNYIRRIVGEGFSGNFLKTALLHVSPEAPYRGPRIFKSGEYTYHCIVNGSFEWFDGVEEIFCGDRKIFECKFHGGSVK